MDKQTSNKNKNKQQQASIPSSSSSSSSSSSTIKTAMATYNDENSVNSNDSFRSVCYLF